MSPDYVLLLLSSLKGIQHPSLSKTTSQELSPSSPKKQTQTKLNTPKSFPTANVGHIFANQKHNNFLLFPPPPLTPITRHIHFSSEAGCWVDCLQLRTPTDNAEASRILLSALITCLDSPSPHRSWRAKKQANLQGCPTSAQRRCEDTNHNLATVMLEKPIELPWAKILPFTF